MAELMSQFADSLEANLPNFERNKIQQIAQDKTKYKVMSKWLKQDRIVKQGGPYIEWRYYDDLGDGAEHFRETDPDTFPRDDFVETAQIPWRMARTKYVFYKTELTDNRGASRIIDLVKEKSNRAMIALAAELEEKAWAAPSGENGTDPFGIPYYIVKNATKGFNGGLPSGHTKVAGIDISAHPNYKNYTFTYSNLTSQTDGLDSMRDMFLDTMWESPVDINDYRNGRGQQYGIYCGKVPFKEFEVLCYGQADLTKQQAADIAPIDGNSMVFKKFPITYIPQLNDDTDYPVYYIDHSVWTPYVQAGWDFTDSTIKATNNHNATLVMKELRYNYCCYDRRRCGVGYKA